MWDDDTTDDQTPSILEFLHTHSSTARRRDALNFLAVTFGDLVEAATDPQSDPLCGDGAFLRAAYDTLLARTKPRPEPPSEVHQYDGSEPS
jgi:hypothetical protein